MNLLQKNMIYYADGTTGVLKDTTLESLQKAVGGYIEFHPTRLPNNLLICVNDEGLLRNLSINKHFKNIIYQPIYGDVAIIHKDDA